MRVPWYGRIDVHTLGPTSEVSPVTCIFACERTAKPSTPCPQVCHDASVQLHKQAERIHGQP